MQRKKETTLKDGDEVDSVLRRIGEIDISRAEIEGEMTIRINEVKTEADTKADGPEGGEKSMEEDVTLKLVIKNKAACLAAMHALGLDDAALAKLWASRKVADGIRIEPRWKK